MYHFIRIFGWFTMSGQTFWQFRPGDIFCVRPFLILITLSLRRICDKLGWIGFVGRCIYEVPFPGKVITTTIPIAAPNKDVI